MIHCWFVGGCGLCVYRYNYTVSVTSCFGACEKVLWEIGMLFMHLLAALLQSVGTCCDGFYLCVCVKQLFSFALQFMNSDFASLSGARIVRIATHPDYQGVSSLCCLSPPPPPLCRCIAVPPPPLLCLCDDS